MISESFGHRNLWSSEHLKRERLLKRPQKRDGGGRRPPKTRQGQDWKDSFPRSLPPTWDQTERGKKIRSPPPPPISPRTIPFWPPQNVPVPLPVFDRRLHKEFLFPSGGDQMFLSTGNHERPTERSLCPNVMS